MVGLTKRLAGRRELGPVEGEAREPSLVEPQRGLRAIRRVVHPGVEHDEDTERQREPPEGGPPEGTEVAPDDPADGRDGERRYREARSSEGARPALERGEGDTTRLATLFVPRLARALRYHALGGARGPVRGRPRSRPRQPGDGEGEPCHGEPDGVDSVAVPFDQASAVEAP